MHIRLIQMGTELQKSELKFSILCTEFKNQNDELGLKNRFLEF